MVRQLSTDFPLETYALCLDEIRKQAAEADNRIKYKKVCGNIKKLFEYGGSNEVSSIIEELKAKYPRRPRDGRGIGWIGSKTGEEEITFPRNLFVVKYFYPRG